MGRKPTGRPRGRPPKPIERHLAEGTYRPDRHAHLLGQTWTSSRRDYPLEGREEDAAELYLAGKTLHETAAALAVTPSVVLKALRQLDIPRRPKGRVPSPETRNGQVRRTIPQRVRDYVYRRDGWVCLACGTSERLSLDHVVPWSVGGSDHPSNLQTLCVPCNCAKGAEEVDYRAGRQAA